MTWLTQLFVVSIVSSVLFFVFAEQDAHNAGMAALLAAAITQSACLYLLGRLAWLQGTNPIVWVGLPMITQPVGYSVAYFMMRSKVSRSLAEPLR